MLGRDDTGSVLGSRAVDAEFWALICEDEKWLDAVFDAIVSAAFEAPTPITRRGSVGSARPARRRAARRTAGALRPWRSDDRPGRRWGWERGPPQRLVTLHHSKWHETPGIVHEKGR